MSADRFAAVRDKAWQLYWNVVDEKGATYKPIRDVAEQLHKALVDYDAASDGEAWVCDWVPDELNEGPDCPYCAGDMCARFDGLFGCRHDRAERHGYPDAASGSGETVTTDAAGNVTSWTAS